MHFFLPKWLVLTVMGFQNYLYSKEGFPFTEHFLRQKFCCMIFHLYSYAGSQHKLAWISLTMKTDFSLENFLLLFGLAPSCSETWVRSNGVSEVGSSQKHKMILFLRVSPRQQPLAGLSFLVFPHSLPSHRSAAAVVE